MKDNMILEKQAWENCRLEKVKKVLDTPNLQEVIKQNKRLQAELDCEIKKNRKLVKALEKYANKDCWLRYGDENLKIVFIYASHHGYETAQQVIKEVEEV